MNINNRLEKMERQLEKAGLLLTPALEQRLREIVEPAFQRDPAIVCADGTVDETRIVTCLTDGELIELARFYDELKGTN